MDDIRLKIDDLSSKVGQIESLLQGLSEPGRHPSSEENFKHKMEEFESRFRQLLNENEKTALNAAIKSQIERFEGKIEQLRTGQFQSITELEGSLKSKVASVASRLEFLENFIQEEKKKLSRETEIILRMERLEAGVKKVAKETDGSKVETVRLKMEEALTEVRQQVSQLQGKIADLDAPDNSFLRTKLLQLEKNIADLASGNQSNQTGHFLLEVLKLEKKIEELDFKIEISKTGGRSAGSADYKKEQEETFQKLQRLEHRMSDMQAQIARGIETLEHQGQAKGVRFEQTLSQLKSAQEQFRIEMETLRLQHERERIESQRKIAEIEQQTKMHLESFKEELICHPLWVELKERMHSFFSDWQQKTNLLVMRMAQRESLKFKAQFSKKFLQILLIVVLGGIAGFQWLRVQVHQSTLNAFYLKFSEPRLKNTLQEAALLFVPKTIENVIGYLTSEVHAQMKKQNDAYFRHLGEVKAKYESHYESVRFDTETLQAEKAILDFEHEALADGKRASYERLQEIKMNRSELRAEAEASLQRLAAVYSHLDRLNGFVLEHKSEDGKLMKEGEIPQEILKSYLSHPDWKVRAKAASLFGQNVSDVPVLVEAALKEQNLNVLVSAIKKAAQLTDCTPSSPFDIDTASHC